MRSAINYYYHMYPNNIVYENGLYTFTWNNKRYILYNVFNNPSFESKRILEYSNIVSMFFLKYNKIILNTDNVMVTMINDKSYVLMETFEDYNVIISLSDIMTFNSKIGHIVYNDDIREYVRNKWIKKIDYLEYEISQLGLKYYTVRSSFNYFIGLAETAISLLSNNILYVGNLTNNRLNNKSTLFDLYNPFNIIIDTKVRNVCEYFKQEMLVRNNVIEDIIDFLEYAKYNNTDFYLFFVRMLFPSFYFDMIEDILFNKKKEQELVPIIEKVNIYEDILTNLYFYLLNKINLPNIEWITRKKLNY